MADTYDYQGLLNQFQPTQADKDAARKAQLQTFFLSLLGTQKGDEFGRLGRGGLLAQEQYTNTLNNSQKAAMERMQAASMAMQLRQSAQTLQANDVYANAITSQPGLQQASTTQPAVQQAPSFGMGDRGLGTAPPAATQAPQAAPTTPQDQFGKMMAQADYYEAVAHKPENKAAAVMLMQAAQKIRDDALKFRNKNTGTKVAMVDGKPVFMQESDHGAPTTVQGYQPPPELASANLGGSELFYDKLRMAPGTSLDRTQSPDSISSNAQSDLNSRRTDARSRELNALKRQEIEGGDQPMSVDAIKNAAGRYNIDGTLPPMGMGKLAGSYRSAILNEAAKQAGGMAPEDQRFRQLENKGGAMAMQQIQKTEAQVGAFEKNFVKNADITLEYSKKVDNTGTPVVNQWLNVGKRSVQGNPTLSAYDASVKATVNEYSKIVSGATGSQAATDSEIKRIEGLLNAAQTPAQVEAVITLMKRETANRMTGFKEQKRELVNNMRGGNSSSSAKVVDFNDLGK